MFPQNNDVLKMVVADGSAIVRAGIKRLLIDLPEIQVVEECVDARCTVAAVADWQPDFVLLDFRLGAGSAVDVMQECRSMSPRPLFIVHTLQTDASTRAISYAAGADVFYDKSKDTSPLINMLRKLAGALHEGYTLSR